MNALSFFGYALMLAVALPLAIVTRRWIRNAWHSAKALRVLSRERRAGETLYDTVEAIAGDAHNWRGIVCPVDVEQTTVRALLRDLPKSCIAERRNLEGRLRAIDGTGALWAPQPPPQNQSGPALWPMIITELGDSETDRLVATDMLARHEFGVAKYGVPLVANNGRDHLADAYQETLDGVVYLRAAFDDEANVRHEQHKLCVLGVVPDMTMIRSRVHQTYIDMLDLAKEIRELIRVRDGR
jgi:hypothetical protein